MTITRKFYALILPLFILAACNDSTPVVVPALTTGRYEILFSVRDIQVPVELEITASGKWVIHNWKEDITLDSLKWDGQKFHVKMPLFNTSLDGEITGENQIAGRWTDHSRDTLYEIPFSAKWIAAQHTPVSPVGSERVYDATFSKGSAQDESKTIGIFYEDKGRLAGTFLTESGDYRFLQGKTTGQSLHLASFDGAHLFYFCANQVGDSLSDGHFYSGRHWSEDWDAVLSPDAALRNPDSLTYLTDKSKAFSFTVLNAGGDSTRFDSEKFQGRVSVVQVFGSWCPNCTDESVLLNELYEKYHAQGLDIIPVAFERTEDFSLATSTVQKQWKELGLTYPVYFGGKANKSSACQVFSGLSKITSYPTAIFIDKKGVVRKIHTGFYGPGTGVYYEKHKAEIVAFVEELLSEAG